MFIRSFLWGRGQIFNSCSRGRNVIGKVFFFLCPMYIFVLFWTPEKQWLGTYLINFCLCSSEAFAKHARKRTARLTNFCISLISSFVAPQPSWLAWCYVIFISFRCGCFKGVAQFCDCHLLVRELSTLPRTIPTPSKPARYHIALVGSTSLFRKYLNASIYSWIRKVFFLCIIVRVDFPFSWEGNTWNLKHVIKSQGPEQSEGPVFYCLIKHCEEEQKKIVFFVARTIQRNIPLSYTREEASSKAMFCPLSF